MTNPKRTIKPAVPQQRPLTKDERIAAAAHNFSQKYQSMAEAVLYNAVNGFAQSGDAPEPEDLVDFTIAIVDKFIEKLNVACDATFDKIVRPKFNDNVE